MSSTVRRRPTYASVPFGVGIAFAATSAIDWPLPWMRSALLMLGIASLVVAVVLVAIGWRAKHNPLASGSDWEPLPPVMSPDLRPPAGAPVPASSRPPKFSGPAGATLPIPRDPIVFPSCWPAGARREERYREPTATVPRTGERPPLRALPPPTEQRDPGIIPFRPRGRRPGEPKR